MKNYDMKSNNKDKKFKGKKDTRNNNASETNGMHSVPLRRKHQMQLGKPKGKIREKNLKGYSKFQNKLLNYLNNSQNSPEQSIQNVIGQDHFQVGRTACAVSLLETAQTNSLVLLRTRTENLF